MDTILDSGDRTTYSTGAVRDMKAGKGRCDLMPLDVVAHFFYRNGLTTAGDIFRNLYTFQVYDKIEVLYDTCNIFGRLAFSDVGTMFLEVAKHFENGAIKYGEHNWEKGIPEWSYLDSAARHFLKWNRGDKDEPHDRAFIWNILALIWTVEHREVNNESNNKD